MSIYDNRNAPAYREAPVPHEWADNPLIMAWWTDAHDHLLADLIDKWQWGWFWKATDALVKITPTDSLDQWRKDDRLCKKYVWYNVMMGFAQARARSVGLTERIRVPQLRTCILCRNQFAEDSLPMPIIERLGVDRLTFCAPCIQSTVLFEGLATPTREDILRFTRELAEAAGRVPPQGFGSRIGDLLDLDDDVREKVLRLHKTKPSKAAIDRNFGSWFDALIDAGVLENGARRNSRGIQCLAKDGHICFSLGEKTIDDMLHALGIEHTKEPHYPASNYRADFEAHGAFIEYFGLVGDPAYDKKTETKLALAKKHRIKLVAVYPVDLASGTDLRRKLGGLLRTTGTGRARKVEGDVGDGGE